MSKTDTTESPRKGDKEAKKSVSVIKKIAAKAKAEVDAKSEKDVKQPIAADTKEVPTTQEPAATADKTIEIVVDKETLENNPELQEKGVEVGDTLAIETESIATDEPKDESAPSEASTSKPKLDPAKIAEFEAMCLSKRQTRSSIITLANEYFDGKAHLKDGLNNKEVYFKIGKKRVPEHGIFIIS